MIRILPVADNSGEFVLWDGDTACGSGKAEFGETVEVLSVEAPDALLAEGMVRALLNAGRIREIPTATCHNEALYPILRRLEFQPTDDGGMWVDIADFFFRGCCHK